MKGEISPFFFHLIERKIKSEKELQKKEICQEIIDEQTKCNYSVEYILNNKDDIVRAVAVNKHTKSTIQLDIVDGRNHTQKSKSF